MANEVPKGDLLIDIIENHLSVEEVKKRIRELEDVYGDNYFLDYDIEEAGIERKPKQDWDYEYYEQVKIKGILGVASKQYFLYFAEVNEYIYNQKLEEKKTKQCKKITAIIAAAAVSILCIVILILYLNDSKANAAEDLDCQQTTLSAYNTQLTDWDLLEECKNGYYF